MSEEIIRIKPEIAKNAYIKDEDYKNLYAESINDPEKFWEREAQIIDWIKPFTKVKNTSFEGDVSIKWFEDGSLNICANAVDRHLAKRAKQTAIIWQGDEQGEVKHIIYEELYREVVLCAKVLKKHGVKKGDRVIIYLPMIVEAAYVMLACARIGAVHSVVFGGFSPEALKGRIVDSGAKIIITANEAVRGGKIVPLKNNVDEALANLSVEKVIVVKRTENKIAWQEKRDLWYHDEIANLKGDITNCPPVEMNAEDPFFILYTSGSTGKPKGVLHTTGGYIVYAALTFKYVFDYKDGEVFWCTADVGWVTGHSYVIYGPLTNGATTLMYEGVPNYPNWSRMWNIIDEHKVNIFYTAPTAIRAQMREGDDYVLATSRKSLRILGSVGEPINPEAWNWYYNIVGNKNCPIVDTWWQTETGGHLITPLVGAMDLKPGSASLPFFGVAPVILDEKNNILEGEGAGALFINDSWPGQMRSLYNDHPRFVQTYFTKNKGMYFTGDGAKRDQDGYYFITGRIDDVLNVSGHRLGTAEIESALVLHELVAESAVIGFPHELKGEGIYAFVTLNSNIEGSESLKKDLIALVRKEIGPIAIVDKIQFVSGLPKTRSGKIMRRILRKIAVGEYEDLGDINTLLNPEIIKELIYNRIG